jgi:hypothetical protein
MSNGDGNAWYVTFNTASNTWATKEIIAGMNGQPPNRFRSRVAMALDSNQIPHVIYPNANDGGLTYANRMGGTWSAGQGLTTVTSTEHPSLTFDKSGVLHLVYYDINSGNIFYQERSGSGSWSSAETVATGMLVTVDQAPSVAVDSLNNAWICFVTSATGDTCQLRKRTGANSYANMNPPKAAGHAPSVYIDASDNVYAFEGHDITVIQPFVQVLNSGNWGPYTQLSTGPPTRDGGSSPRFDPLWPSSTVDIDTTALDETNGSFGLTYYIHGTPPGAVATPTADLSTTTLTFASQGVGTTSAAQSVTLTNTGNAALTIASITLTGANSGDFAQTNTCPVSPTTLAAGSNCSINVTFKPTATGTRNASVTITDNAANNPQSVALTGTGVAPVVSLSPASLSFGNQSVGTSSAAQNVTLSNTGNAALTITSIVITGTNSGDFSETNTCPASPATLAAGANCTISVTFKPTATGNRAASISITDNASGSQQAVSLTGTGTQAPAVTLSPTSLSFGNERVGTSSAAQSVTLTNSGNATLTLSIAIAGTNSGDFSQTNTCGASVAAGANCMINVTFKPTATGNRSASVTITDNAPGSPHTVALTGTGTAPAVTLAPTSLNFAGQLVTTASAAQSITLTNSGTATLNITSITITGANSGDFSETNTCGASVAAGANCSVSVTFKPTATGSRAASVTITDDAAGGPQAVALSGTGTDFTIDVAGGSSNTATVTAGQAATYNLQVTPVSGFNGTVTLSCSGAPSEATCTPSVASVTPNGNTASAFAVNVATMAPSIFAPRGMPPRYPPRTWIRIVLPWVVLFTLVLLLARVAATRRHSRWALAPAFVVVLGILSCIGGCTGGSSGGGNHNPGTPTGTYTLMVTGGSNGVNRTLQLTLKVN